MQLILLRNLLLVDALALIGMGLLFIGAPRSVASVFHFTNLPVEVSYLLGLWGSVLVSLGIAYAIVSKNPLRHRLWVQTAILRAALETLIGLVYLTNGAVNFAQAGFGTILGAVLTVGYAALYPRKPRVVPIAPDASGAGQ